MECRRAIAKNYLIFLTLDLPAGRQVRITMVRTKIIENRIHGLANDMYLAGYQPGKIMLFGSYASGKATDQSDIDVAIWAKGFTGARTYDIEKLPILLANTL